MQNEFKCEYIYILKVIIIISYFCLIGYSMEKSFCSLHYGEEEKYLCSHPTCLKLEGNKPMCIECLEKHKKGRTKFHEKITIQ